ncbi:hypothetical protein [Streptomyces sp. NPDC050560]|uniref:hypothetical protein n=1 Tax=Streptomyces sp. NPDC050560 TaxID=3365630 RepID=UPI00379CBA3F
MDDSGDGGAGGVPPGTPRFSAASRPLMEFVAARSADDLSLAARSIWAGDFHLAIRSLRRAVRLIDFGTATAALGREFSDGDRRAADDGRGTPGDDAAAKVVAIAGEGRRAARGGARRAEPAACRETELLGRLRQGAAQTWEAFGAAAESSGPIAWELLGHLGRRREPLATKESRLAGTAEVYQALVELNAAALRWERSHWCDRSWGEDRWCAASCISPLFPTLPPGPGATAPGVHVGATTW